MICPCDSLFTFRISLVSLHVGDLSRRRIFVDRLAYYILIISWVIHVVRHYDSIVILWVFLRYFSYFILLWCLFIVSIVYLPAYWSDPLRVSRLSYRNTSKAAVTEKILFHYEKVTNQSSPELCPEAYLYCIAIGLIFIFSAIVVGKNLESKIGWCHPNHVQNKKAHHKRVSFDSKFSEETLVFNEIGHVPRKQAHM